MRWMVDAMNVIGARPDGWWRDRRGAMEQLVQRLERWAIESDEQVVVVFEQPLRPPLQSDVVILAHAPRAAPNSADDEIVRLLGADEDPQTVTVVTSDALLAERVRATGASVTSATTFRRLLDDVGRDGADRA